ncbi:unnamed protein product, partial [Didymodactylos carnosus]
MASHRNDSLNYGHPSRG